MKFIELTKVTIMGGAVSHGTPIFMNADHIVSFHENQNEITLVHLTGGAKLTVSERAAEIKKLLSA